MKQLSSSAFTVWAGIMSSFELHNLLIYRNHVFFAAFLALEPYFGITVLAKCSDVNTH